MAQRKGVLAAAVGVAVVAVVVALVVVPRLGDDSSSPPTSPTSPTTDTEAGDPLPLGSVEETSGGNGPCPRGAECSGITVTCPAMTDPLTAVLAVRQPQAEITGVLVLFSGGSGTEWWDNGQPTAAAFLGEVVSAGVKVFEVQWSSSWLDSASKDGTGPAAAACRPASVLRYLYDRDYAPLGLGRAAGVCGFCASGNSGGSTQVALSLSHYGLDSIIDVAALTGGPPHAGLARGCLQAPGDEDLAYDVPQAVDMDSSFGLRRNGPCRSRDASFTDTWNANDPALGGSDHRHDETKVVVLLGDKDDTVAPSHARLFVEQLQAQGSPQVQLVEMPGVGHRIETSASGLAALRTALLGA